MTKLIRFAETTTYERRRHVDNTQPAPSTSLSPFRRVLYYLTCLLPVLY